MPEPETSEWEVASPLNRYFCTGEQKSVVTPPPVSHSLPDIFVCGANGSNEHFAIYVLRLVCFGDTDAPIGREFSVFGVISFCQSGMSVFHRFVKTRDRSIHLAFVLMGLSVVGSASGSVLISKHPLQQ